MGEILPATFICLACAMHGHVGSESACSNNEERTKDTPPRKSTSAAPRRDTKTGCVSCQYLQTEPKKLAKFPAVFTWEPLTQEPCVKTTRNTLKPCQKPRSSCRRQVAEQPVVLPEAEGGVGGGQLVERALRSFVVFFGERDLRGCKSGSRFHGSGCGQNLRGPRRLRWPMTVQPVLAMSGSPGEVGEVTPGELLLPDFRCTTPRLRQWIRSSSLREIRGMAQEGRAFFKARSRWPIESNTEQHRATY